MTGIFKNELNGPFQARYLAFLETVTGLRPQLHRYCSRMTGSVLDGEDMVQEALFEAYRKLDQFDDTRSLTPWLFRIAHNRCIDFLRRRMSRAEAEGGFTKSDYVMPIEPLGNSVGNALEHLVLALPPKERACVLLKDVFEYSLEETAELVSSSVGGVKAALSRGRSKLTKSSTPLPKSHSASAETRQLLSLYVDRFNRHDWDGVRELIRADAQLLVADQFRGEFRQSPYFRNYEGWMAPWRLAVGEVDNEIVALVLQRDGELWLPLSAIRLEVIGEKVAGAVDYVHCPWVLAIARSILIGEESGFEVETQHDAARFPYPN